MPRKKKKKKVFSGSFLPDVSLDTSVMHYMINYSDYKHLRGGKGFFSLQFPITIHHGEKSRWEYLLFYAALPLTKELSSEPESKGSTMEVAACWLAGRPAYVHVALLH